VGALSPRIGVTKAARSSPGPKGPTRRGWLKPADSVVLRLPSSLGQVASATPAEWGLEPRMERAPVRALKGPVGVAG
jgi:hypothetical protein